MTEDWIATLVARAQHGDGTAFERLVQRFRPLVVHTVRSVLGGARWVEWHEDVVQEAFLKAWRHIRTFDGRARFSTWLRTLALRVAIDESKKRSHWFAARSEPLAAKPDDSDARLDDPTTRIAVRAALERLGDLYLVPFLLMEFEGESSTEIAARLDMNANTVSTRVRRARLSLRHLLDEGASA